jgi:glutamate N-acetyltransferase/amino-acid N-acetyltransferase
MSAKTSPLAPAAFPDLPQVAGVRLATGMTGLRYKGRDDLLWAEFVPGTVVAGCFTTSATRAAPVRWCETALAGGRARALVVNAGNANAFTGPTGARAVAAEVDGAAAVLGCAREEVFVASTGVIGVPLDPKPIVDMMADLSGRASDAADAWAPAAKSIMTTDTFPKGASATVTIGGRSVTVVGFAKGSGMIAPNMATMLGFVFTDAAIGATLAQRLLARGVDRSFNAITVDGDTSTNDCVMLFATGAAGNPLLAEEDADGAVFAEALEAVLSDLARQVVRDGEGATKFVTLKITGAEDDGAARRVGLTVANSPLVKTAIAGSDANWGRIVAALGRSGERVAEDRLRIHIGGVLVAENGAVHPDYDEKAYVAGYMKGQEIDIAVDVGVGDGVATVWTCDLTHGYIDINADYRS